MPALSPPAHSRCLILECGGSVGVVWMVSARPRRQTFPYSVGHGERGCVEMKEWSTAHQDVGRADIAKLAVGRLWDVDGSTLGRMGVGLISLFVLSVVALLLQQPAHAGESFEWTGEGRDGNWVNSCNWHPEGDCKETYPRQVGLRRPGYHQAHRERAGARSPR
jgi:hypothetical protein